MFEEQLARLNERAAQATINPLNLRYERIRDNGKGMPGQLQMQYLNSEGKTLRNNASSQDNLSKLGLDPGTRRIESKDDL